MPEDIGTWWQRRQQSKGTTIPYALGTYRDQWAPFPMLIRQYHPDLNGGIALSQIPPVAEVLLLWQCDAGHTFAATPKEQRNRPDGTRRRSAWCPECSAKAGGKRAKRPVTKHPAPNVPVGQAFVSAHAPRKASRAEPELRRRLEERLDLDFEKNAIRTRQPFFGRYEVWPDVVLPELTIALEYDTTGRDGLEHVGPREDADRRKDQLLRAVGWEVVRVRVGPLRAIGEFDVVAPGISGQLVDRVIERLGRIRGELFVGAYLR